MVSKTGTASKSYGVLPANTLLKPLRQFNDTSILDKAGIIDRPYKCRLCGHQVKANEYHIHNSSNYQSQSDNVNSGKYTLSKKQHREQGHQRQLERERQYIQQAQGDIVSRQSYTTVQPIRGEVSICE